MGKQNNIEKNLGRVFFVPEDWHSLSSNQAITSSQKNLLFRIGSLRKSDWEEFQTNVSGANLKTIIFSSHVELAPLVINFKRYITFLGILEKTHTKLVCEELSVEIDPTSCSISSIGELYSLSREALRRDRLRNYQKRALAEGKVIGRPKLRDDSLICRLRESGLSIREIAKRLTCSPATVHKALGSSEVKVGVKP